MSSALSFVGDILVFWVIVLKAVTVHGKCDYVALLHAKDPVASAILELFVDDVISLRLDVPLSE